MSRVIESNGEMRKRIKLSKRLSVDVVVASRKKFTGEFTTEQAEGFLEGRVRGYVKAYGIVITELAWADLQHRIGGKTSVDLPFGMEIGVKTVPLVFDGIAGAMAAFR